MTSQWIDVAATSGGKYGAYLSLPPAGKGPGLVLFQEIFGVNRHIRAVADQYALDGFVVLAPDLFWRDAPRVELGYEGADRERALVLMKGADPKLLAEDIKTTVAALRARPELAGKVGAVGYCMGGRLAYIAAATAGVDAASSFYGGGIQDQLERDASISCPCNSTTARRTPRIPMEAVEKVKAVRGKEGRVLTIPTRATASTAGTVPSITPSAALSHGRTLAFSRPRSSKYLCQVRISDLRLTEYQLREVRRPQVRLVGAIELVQLRRLHIRAGEHRVHLAAVVDVVLQEVGEDARHGVADHALASRQQHRHLEALVGERFAQRDEASIGGVLLARDICTGLEWLLRLEMAPRISWGGNPARLRRESPRSTSPP
jgi:carboxymethylenebutenolidase